jgi:phage terminase large subunit-like protein
MRESITRYIDDVLNGRRTCGRWEQAMVRRHIDDLEHGADRGLRFDERLAARACAFFPRFLRHSKGEWAGYPLHLEPWQQFIIWSLFGWLRDDGARRFRTAYMEVARKNGKTTLAAGIGLYLLDADGEPGAEVYTAATKRDQARIAHGEATRMVKASPLLRRRIRVYRDNLHVVETASKFEPLGRDADSMDGLNVHGAIVDEIHAHRTRDVWDVLDTATGSRRQPLIVGITTAGFDRQSLCWELHEYTEKVLDGALQDDSWFGAIYAIDDADNDPFDESIWPKANPNLGVSVKLDDMRRLAMKAREMPSALNSFLRLRLNRWTQAESSWINMDVWRENAAPVDADALKGRTCYGGLDLSSTTDITAFVLVFPPTGAGDRYHVLCRFWIPEDSMRERSLRDRVPYDAWVRDGYITATPGNVIDYDYVLAQIDEDAQRYDIAEIAFDRWGATRIVQDLEDAGMAVVQFGQGFSSMSSPTKELERLLLARKLAHGGNPVLSWMAGNVVVREDPAGNIKPDKGRSSEKIDGIVALIMALDRALRHTKAAGSVYEERGLVIL